MDEESFCCLNYISLNAMPGYKVMPKHNSCLKLSFLESLWLWDLTYLSDNTSRFYDCDKAFWWYFCSLEMGSLDYSVTVPAHTYISPNQCFTASATLRKGIEWGCLYDCLSSPTYTQKIPGCSTHPIGTVASALESYYWLFRFHV